MAGRKSQRTQNLSYAGFAGLAGCATIAFVMVALVVGLWLDAQFGRRGPFTIGLLCLSVPISLGVMVWIALTMTKRILPPATPSRTGEPHSQED
mgnify:CR=1 FL=1|jgi:hypothetical protein